MKTLLRRGTRLLCLWLTIVVIFSCGRMKEGKHDDVVEEDSLSVDVVDVDSLEKDTMPERDVWWEDTTEVLHGYVRYSKEFSERVELCSDMYSFLVDYPTSVIKNHERIDAWLRNRVGRPNRKSWSEIAASKAEWYLASARSELRELGEAGWHYNFWEETAMRARISNERFVSYQMWHFEEDGGIHGHYSEHLVSFDHVHNEEIDCDYLFKPERMSDVLSILLDEAKKTQQYKEWEPNIMDYVTNRDEDGNETGGFTLPTPGLSEDGIVFSFQPYAISCFAAGTFHFTIPYSRIKHCLTTRGKWCVGLKID